MEFWGVEVKPGAPLKIFPEDDLLIHLSQAALGECKKDKNEPVMIFAKVGTQKFVLGTLSSDKFPQISFDVVFEKEFELSHSSKTVSVHFCGYQTQVPADDEYPSDSSEEEDVPLMNADKGKSDVRIEIPKPAAANAKPKANVELKKEESEESDDSGDKDDSDDDEEDDSSDSDGAEPMSDEDEDEDGDEDEDEDEETPKKVESAKKRSGDSAIKTPAQSKKQKTATPQKRDGKKNVHTATPHPAKKPAVNGNMQSPKSGGQFSCKPCDRSFNSGTALQSHSKAKHGK